MSNIALAQSLTSESSTAKHTVGTVYKDDATGAEYVYCVDSGSGIAQYKPATITTAFSATAITKANADKGYDIVIPQIAVTASYYFWGMRNSGNLTTAYVHVASACASETALFTTATAGRLDDTSTSQTLIQGIELTATAATAAASANATAKIRNPKAIAAEVRIDAAESVGTATSEALSTVLAGSIANNATSVATASSAASKAQAEVDLWDAAASAYLANAVANSHSNAVSAAVSVNAAIGTWMSAVASGVSSGIGKAF